MDTLYKSELETVQTCILPAPSARHRYELARTHFRCCITLGMSRAQKRERSGRCRASAPCRCYKPGQHIRLQSMDRSLHPPLLQNRACGFPRTRLLSDMPFCHKASVQLLHTAIETCHLTGRASPLRGITPSRRSAGLALMQPSCVRLLAHHRPHVSISEALPSAFAS